MFNIRPWRRSRTPTTVMPREANPLVRLREDVEAMFDRFLGRWPAPIEEVGLGRFWSFDVSDRDAELVVRAEVPGFSADEIDVQVCGSVLTITAEKKQEQSAEAGPRAVEERHYARFHRTVTLPEGADTDHIEARCQNGVLEVHVPKAGGKGGRRVPVQE